jgi:uncharacterized protein (DUF2141 family)
MLKLSGWSLFSLLLVGSISPAGAAILGPDSAACRAGAETPAILVRISGLRAKTGSIRVQSYGGDPNAYFDKGTYLKRIDIPEPTSDPLEVCVAVPRPGIYAISVRHDVNGNGKSDSSDGGGMSGNPEMSLLDVVFKRKPDPSQVGIQVGQGVATTSIVMRYVQGGSFRPVGGGSTR